MEHTVEDAIDEETREELQKALDESRREDTKWGHKMESDD